MLIFFASSSTLKNPKMKVTENSQHKNVSHVAVEINFQGLDFKYSRRQYELPRPNTNRCSKNPACSVSRLTAAVFNGGGGDYTLKGARDNIFLQLSMIHCCVCTSMHPSNPWQTKVFWQNIQWAVCVKRRAISVAQKVTCGCWMTSCKRTQNSRAWREVQKLCDIQLKS